MDLGLWTLDLPRDLHRDERGSVQSLSFVLTVPLLSVAADQFELGVGF